MPERTPVIFSGGGTGGHLYPALALARALTECRPDVAPTFVGAERGIEARVLPERGADYMLVPVQGLRRDRPLANGPALLALAKALRATAVLFHRLRPRLVVVTGGYAGGPSGVMAVLTRTPLVLQEQNSVPGLTTRVLSLFAREVHVAFPEAVARLPGPARSRARVSGNPVIPPDPHSRRDAAAAFGLDAESPVVLAVGGSQGAEALNSALLRAVEMVEREGVERPLGLQLLWATGPANEDRVREALGALGAPAWVRALGYIDEMPLALSLATLSVSRAGAMATSEFLAWGVPSILVPLPTAAADHQRRNAEALERAGAAIHLPEQTLDGGVLWESVTRIMTDPGRLERVAHAARERGRPEAARDIAESLAAHLPPARRAA